MHTSYMFKIELDSLKIYSWVCKIYKWYVLKHIVNLTTYIMGIMINSSLDIKIIKYLMHCTLKIAYIDFPLESSFIYGDQRILAKKKSF